MHSQCIFQGQKCNETAFSHQRQLHKDDQKFLSAILARHRDLAFTLKNHYLKIAEQKSVREANLSLGRLDRDLLVHDLNLSSDNQAIKAFCEAKADLCSRYIERYSIKRAFAFCSRLVAKYQINYSGSKASTELSLLNRFKCEKWWKRQVRQLQRQRTEQARRCLNLVHKHQSTYLSKDALSDHLWQQQQSLEYLENTSIENEQGQQLTLKEVFDKSVANPKIRHAEMMTRMAGFESVAQRMGHVAEFYTLTAPSRMHCSLSSGKPNPKYSGETPKQVQDYFVQQWALIRSYLDKHGLRIYGFRIAEPHHDATPHWHMLLFMHPSERKRIRRYIRRYALSTDGKEKGAQKHRFKAELVDNTKGSATGYIAKYVSKNLTGEHIDDDLNGNNGNDAAINIRGWASLWKIRQFQQIGGPSVSVWRELRKLRGKAEHESMQEASLAADAGDWAGFVMAMGGPTLPRKHHPIKLAHEELDIEHVDTDSGEILPVNRNRYGEVKQARVIGLESSSGFQRTRLHEWSIVIDTSEGAEPSSLTWDVTAGERREGPTDKGAASAPWTSVNNCTNPNKLMN